MIDMFFVVAYEILAILEGVKDTPVFIFIFYVNALLFASTMLSFMKKHYFPKFRRKHRKSSRHDRRY